MKRYIFISLLILASLTACVRNEMSRPDRAVSFLVGQYVPGVKAVSLNDSEDAITSFSSKGFLYAVGVNTVQDFFGTDGESISYDSSVPEWTPSHPYYWPKSGDSYINFVSWFDKNGDPDDVDNVSETSISWTIDGTNRSLLSDDNIMIADEAWHYNDNAQVYTEYSLVEEGVPTLFRHLLARICFVVRLSTLGDEGVTYSLSVSNFVLGRVYTTGSITLSNSEPASLPSTSAWSGSWVTSGTKTNISSPIAGLNDNLSIASTDGVVVFPMHSMIPQSVSNSYISFDYTIRTTYDANNYIEENASTGLILLSGFTGAPASWQMNKKVTYKVTINPELSEILIDPVDTDWVGPLAPAPITIE